MLQILYENSAPALHDNLPESKQNFRRALDAAAIHDLLQEGMHVKEIDMGLTDRKSVV